MSVDDTGSCLLSVVGCRVSGVGSRLLTVDYRLSLSMVVVGSWMSGVGCWLLIVFVSFPLPVPSYVYTSIVRNVIHEETYLTNFLSPT